MPVSIHRLLLASLVILFPLGSSAEENKAAYDAVNAALMRGSAHADIIRELTGHFLRARGSQWMRSVDTRLAQLYLTRAGDPEQVGDRVLILAGVLPDRINQDYGQFREEIVTSINSQPVRNIRDVYRVLGPDGHVERLGLKGIGIDLALDVEALPEANARIAQRYRIPLLRNPPPPPPGDHQP